MKPLSRLLLATSCSTLGYLTFSAPVFACETLVEENAPPVRITAESAVIVWDKANHREEFIRRASFATKNRDFGFLVPTPSRPTLSEANADIFNTLQTVASPPRQTHDTWKVSFTPVVASLVGTAARSSAHITQVYAKRSVQVLENRRIGEYQAAVLSARNSSTLKKWLATNGYSTPPNARKWLSQYVRNGWFITAFKIAKKDNDLAAVSSDTVRLSFSTPRPFYPYHEPQPAHKTNAKSRSLRVFFLGDERVVGQIDAPQKPVWPGKMVWSDDLVGEDLEHFNQQMATKNLPSARLTVFEDNAAPRPGVGNLYFSPDSNQSSLKPVSATLWHQRTVRLPLDIVALGIVGIFMVFSRNRKRHGSQL